MMKAKKMSKDYDGLDPEERFQLYMQAAAREDDWEQRRLSATCPRVTYSMPEADYLNRVKAADNLTRAFVVGLEYQRGKIDGLAIIEESLGAPQETLKGFDAKLAIPFTIVNRLIALTKRAIACRLRMEIGIYESICREKMGIEPEVVLDAMETCEVLSWLDLESLEGAGSDVPELALEELDLESFVADTDAALQEEGETLTSSYAAAWERAIEGEL
jgi:hypothetical protein